MQAAQHVVGQMFLRAASTVHVQVFPLLLPQSPRQPHSLFYLMRSVFSVCGGFVAFVAWDLEVGVSGEGGRSFFSAGRLGWRAADLWRAESAFRVTVIGSCYAAS